MRLLFDIEGDNLLPDVTRMWTIIITDIDTNEFWEFLEGDFGWKELLDRATMVAGHNILGYDLGVFLKLFGYELPPHVSIVDTLILSQVLDYNRFGPAGHGLARWGLFFGFEKIEFEDFSRYTPEMSVYCKRDVELNVMVIKFLLAELKTLIAKQLKAGLDTSRIKNYLRAEQAATWWSTLAQIHGWPFDQEAASALYLKLEAKMNEAYLALSARLGNKVRIVDKVKDVIDIKTPKWTKKGAYAAHTANWFDIDPWEGADARPIDGPYCRIQFEELSLDSVADVKVFLFRNGWVPTEYNFKTSENGRTKERGSPKITEDSLEFLGGDGKLYSEFLTAKARFSILKTWLDNVDGEGNLHGDCMIIGTPSMRARHSIIVNIPSGDAPYGKEMRSLFIARPGWTLVGCDSKGNQARGLAHFLGDPTFIDTLLNGDIHQYNADLLTKIVRGIKGVPPDYVVPRSAAKRILYAFLFGASGAKLWSYIFGTLDAKKGNLLKAEFVQAVPGFAKLLETLATSWRQSSRDGNNYITSIMGNKIYVDSLHKLLVYLLQSTEKATCSAALMLAMQRFKEAEIPFVPCIYYHDEIDFMVPDEYAEAAAKIGQQAFADGPKLFGIEIMDGDSKIGRNWYEVH